MKKISLIGAGQIGGTLAHLIGLKKLANEVVAKHRLIESFLVEVMQFNPNEVHEIAEEIEHINSPVFFSKVRKMLKQDTTDPHGSNIPKTDF